MTAVNPIQMADAGKRYIKYDDQAMIIARMLRFRSRTKRSDLWAVRHVDLEAKPGDCVGVIGRNGAGKTTMLQMLAGVTAPSEGMVAVRGRIAPLIAVGVGFHPELTGRENVFVNGTILGLPQKEIAARFDDIVEFSEIGGFIDTPVKFYSSGMFVRLGFAVAIQAEPDVLLVDEVLAVGDVAFQWKCFDRMMQIRQSGTTVAVVSHNLNAVRKLCDRTMLMSQGRVVFDGDTNEAISRFHEVVGEAREVGDEDGRDLAGGWAKIESVELFGPDGRPTAHVHTGQEVTVRITARFDRDIADPVFGFSLSSEKGVNVYSESSISRGTGSFRAGERVTYEATFRVALPTGSYLVNTGLTASDLKTSLDVARPMSFYVSGRNLVRGAVDLEADFVLRREADPWTPSPARPNGGSATRAPSNGEVRDQITDGV